MQPILIESACPNCNRIYNVPADRLGRTVTCSACKQPFVLNPPDQPPQQSPPSRTQALDSIGQSTAISNQPANYVAKPTSGPNVPLTISRVRPDRFQILEELGSGAFGTVYKARDTQLDRLVALKIPKLGALGSPQDAERFLREARAAGNLRHPNIVPIFDAGQIGENYFIASAFIEGKTLECVLARRDRLTLKQAAVITQKVAAALHFAHQQGVIHRDVKPANIILDTNQEPLLLDFGMAYRDEGDALKTQEGARLGTPAYMSPEQHAGGAVDSRSDQWALGVILFEALTGVRPFKGANILQLAFSIRDSEVVPPCRLRPGLDRDLERICTKCLEKAPTDRYATCQHLADDLRRWSRGEVIHARHLGVVQRLARAIRKHRWAAGIGGIVILLIAIMVAALSRPAQQSELVLENISNQELLIGEKLNLKIRTTDPKVWKQRVVFSLTDSPSDVDIDSQTGDLRFHSDEAGDYRLCVKARDPRSGKEDDVRFQVKVVAPLPAPVLAPISQFDVGPGERLAVQAAVENIVQLGNRTRFEITESRTGLSIDERTGAIVWEVPANQNPGRYPITVRATADWPGRPSSTTSFMVRVLGGIELLDVTPVPDQQIKPGVEWQTGIQARDRRPRPGPLTYTLGDAPPGVRIDGSTGQLAWSPTPAQADREHKITVRVTSTAPGQIEKQLSIHVRVEPNPLPVVAQPAAPPPRVVLDPDPLKPEQPWAVGNQAVEAALQRRIPNEFVITHLAALSDISLLTGVPIFLDPSTSDTTVGECRVAKGETLFSVLNRLLYPNKLSYRVSHGVVFVYRPDSSAVLAETKVYKLRLAHRTPQAQATLDAIVDDADRKFFWVNNENSKSLFVADGVILPNCAVMVVCATDDIFSEFERQGKNLLIPTPARPDPRPLAPPPKGAAKPDDALKHQAEFNFIQEPLSDVLAALSRKHKVAIRFDEALVQNSPFSLQLGGVTLENGLLLLMSSRQTLFDDYQVIGQDIVLTSQSLPFEKHHPLGSLGPASEKIRTALERFPIYPTAIQTVQGPTGVAWKVNGTNRDHRGIEMLLDDLRRIHD